MKHFLRPLIGQLAHALPAWLLVLLLPGAACAQAPAPAWTTALALHALSGYSAVQATVLDASGNVYLLGTFVGSVAFGATTLTSSGSDIFVAKYSPATSGFVWAQQAGGAYNKVYGLAVSGSSVYIAGFFAGTIGFGGVALTSAGGNDGFVAKLTDAGATASFTWAQRFGGAGSDAAYGLAVNGPAVYVAGEFGGTAAFGPLALASAGNQDGFVAKLVDAGPTAAVAWAQRLGAAATTRPTRWP